MEKTKKFFFKFKSLWDSCMQVWWHKKYNTFTAPKKDLKVVIEIFEKVGFKVNSELVNLKDDQSKYYAIYVRKVSNE